jgi:hypothetical protein
MAAKLLDTAKKPVNVAGVFAKKPALEHQREGLTRAVPYLAQTDDALVGHDLDDAGAERGADDLGAAYVGDPEL